MSKGCVVQQLLFDINSADISVHECDRFFNSALLFHITRADVTRTKYKSSKQGEHVLYNGRHLTGGSAWVINVKISVSMFVNSRIPEQFIYLAWRLISCQVVPEPGILIAPGPPLAQHNTSDCFLTSGAKNTKYRVKVNNNVHKPLTSRLNCRVTKKEAIYNFQRQILLFILFATRIILRDTA